MRQFLSVLLIGLALYGAYRFQLYWKDFKTKQEMTDRERAGLAQPKPPPVPDKLPGMNPTYEKSLETSLQAAKSNGPVELKKWLNQYRGYVADPRLADIELDYVLLVDRTDVSEARRVFAAVKQRTPPDSPVYERVKRLSRTYE